MHVTKSEDVDGDRASVTDKELFDYFKCPSYLRTAGQLLLILVACCAACWLLGLYTRSIRGLVSGEVIDWNTGRAATYVEVRADELNFSKVVARADAHGHFSFQPLDAPTVYFLFAAPPRYGRLLQTTFGHTIVVYRKSERVRNVVVPAIPATELSGHIYGSDRKPISGCYVSALTRASHFDISAELQVQGGGTRKTLPYDFAEADDPNKLMDVELSTTDVNGAYVFHRLGADRYFILARCEEPPGKDTPLVWEPMLYPDVNSIVRAQQITLLPGDRRAGIDFHMQRKRAYSLQGNIIFSDHSAAKPTSEATYSQYLVVFRSDRALTSTGLGREPCWISANAGTFRCDSLLPGEYTFYFEIGAGLGAASNIPTQTAKVRYTVPAVANQVFAVQLHELPDNLVRDHMPYKGPGGSLDFEKVCSTASDGRPAIQVLAWGQRHAGGACYYMTLWGTTKLLLPRDNYNVNVFEAAFVPGAFRSYLGDNSKFEELLMKHGARIKLDLGQTIEPSLPILTTTQLINIALGSLRTSP